jgi:protein gp37
MPSKIEWTDETWNPVTGCTSVSPGCRNCYARRMATRLQAMGQARYAHGFEVTEHPAALMEPLVSNPGRKSRMVFACSMGDLFHPAVRVAFIRDVLLRMELAANHTFQLLTKRPERAAELASRLAWPRNLWLGTSIESAEYLGRITHLLQVPVETHFLSLEPLLGPILNLPLSGIDWVICGGETGAGRRPMEPEWPRQVRDQCVAAGVPFFFKRWGHLRGPAAHQLDGRTWTERP